MSGAQLRSPSCIFSWIWLTLASGSLVSKLLFSAVFRKYAAYPSMQSRQGKVSHTIAMRHSWSIAAIAFLSVSKWTNYIVNFPSNHVTIIIPCRQKVRLLIPCFSNLMIARICKNQLSLFVFANFRFNQALSHVCTLATCFFSQDLPCSTFAPWREKWFVSVDVGGVSHGRNHTMMLCTIGYLTVINGD